MIGSYPVSLVNPVQCSCYHHLPGVLRPTLAVRSKRSIPMSTEASQRGSGSLTTDRGTSRLRPTPAADALGDTSPQSVSAVMRRMSPGEFNTAMIHFYRGEVQRSNTWRNLFET